MKICQVLASFGDGGLEKHVRELSIQLVSMGHEVTVLGHPAFLKTLDPKIQQYAIPTQLSRHDPRLMFAVLRLVRNSPYDIIHGQANKAVVVLAKLRWLISCPMVGTLHNIKRNIRAFHRLDHTITVSQHLAKDFKLGTVSVVYNGIDKLRVRPLDIKEHYNLPLDKPVICAVGRLVEAKGFDVLLAAVAGLKVSVLIMGDGPEKARLETAISQLPPETTCRLLGHHDAVPELLANCDGVVISSLREGFSYVFSEAILLGANVLSTDVPVANEFLPKTLIVPIDDSQSLAQRLQLYLSQQQLWREAMVSARRQAQQLFSLSTMASQTVSVYEHLLTVE